MVSALCRILTAFLLRWELLELFYCSRSVTLCKHYRLPFCYLVAFFQLLHCTINLPRGYKPQLQQRDCYTKLSFIFPHENIKTISEVIHQYINYAVKGNFPSLGFYYPSSCLNNNMHSLLMTLQTTCMTIFQNSNRNPGESLT